MPHPADDYIRAKAAQQARGEPTRKRSAGKAVAALCLAAAAGLGYLGWHYFRAERKDEAVSRWQVHVERPGQGVRTESLDARGDESEICRRILDLLTSAGPGPGSQPAGETAVLSVRFAHGGQAAGQRGGADKKSAAPSVTMETTRKWLRRTVEGKYYYAPAGRLAAGKLHPGLFDSFPTASEHFAGYLAGELKRLHEVHKETLRTPPAK